MAARLARRDLLKGRLKPGPELLRSPWAIAESEFLKLCQQCPDCVEACETGVLRIGPDGYPQLSFRHGECEFCHECENACKTGALDAGRARQWDWVAEISANCLAINAVTCRSCGDSCEEEALFFRLMTMGRALPVVDQKACTGCGACVRVCPVQAVHIIHPEPAGTNGADGKMV